MARQERISLGNGKWFSPGASMHYGEDTRWNGNNHISCATGSQWEHEELYHTRSGTWILHSWSQWHGSTPSYRILEDAEAHAWLIAQGHADAVPAEVVAAAEV